ncbi:peptidoglycan-binding protein [Coleofasciculus sp. LEGE 07092]|nr:peptidoglycan-binding protein [Coleofasciculus sp. LEGE 07081]MBE9128482.1 peptidoglycan-binding protein [Coleofasciculus sp. LEGE 07081]MBE9148698.1 peptidoglycan-binding protein [Coleofasciculus sp. LEGE 07092]
METLAYLDLALAYEAPANTTPESLQLDEWLTLPKFSTSVRLYLLTLVVIFGIFGIAGEALAQTIRQGSRGSDVTEVQQRLRELGYFKEQPTGYFGEITEDAVIGFQLEKGLTPDGIVGQRTRTQLFGGTVGSSFNTAVSLGTLPPPTNLMGTLPPPPNSSGTFPLPPSIPGGIPIQDVTQEPFVRELSPGDRGQEVIELQLKLRQEGFDPGAVDGVYGIQTERAVRQFQITNGLLSNGVASQETLAALGIVAEIAGCARAGYVVVVPVSNGDTLTSVQRYISSACPDDSRRGKFVNAGAFRSRASAESRSYFLRSQGLDARVARF